MNKYVKYVIDQFKDLNGDKLTYLTFSFVLPNGNICSDRFCKFIVSSDEDIFELLDFYGVPFNGKKIKQYDVVSMETKLITTDKLFI